MARNINFFDGATSGTTPTIGNIVASNLVQHANDAAYEATELGAPTTGNLYYNTTSNCIRYYNGFSWVSIVDEEKTQTLTNKTIDGTDATGTNTVSADGTDISFDNAASGLTATEVQGAIDEVEGRVDTAETDISNLETLSGVAGATDNGTFTGTTIPDSVTTKAALQSLETEVELKVDTALVGAVNGVASLDGTGRLPNAQLPVTAMEFQGSFDPTGPTPNLTNGTGDTGDFYRVSVAGSHDFGAGSITFAIGDSVIYNGSIWEKYDEETLGDTDSLPEGSTNLYYTNTRADARIALASIDDLADVDTTTATPNINEVLTWDGVSDWVPLAAPGAGSAEGIGLNFLESNNSNFNGTVGEWVSYADAAATTPADGTGGAPNITFSQSSAGADIIRGEGSAKIAKDAANRQGEGVSVDFSIDPKDQAANLSVRVDYKTTANYVTGDIIAYVYDVTNASLVGALDNEDNGEFPGHSGDGITLTGTFLSASNSTDYRLIFHIATTNALAYDLTFDRVRISPDNLPPIIAVTSAAKAHLASAASHPTTGTTQVVPIDTVLFDNNNVTDIGNNRFIVPTSGKYYITGSVGFAANGAGVRAVSVRVNTTIRMESTGTPNGGTQDIINVSGLLDLTAGDLVDLAAFQNSGGALAYRTGIDETILDIHQVLDSAIFSDLSDIDIQESTSAGFISYPLTAAVWGDLTTIVLNKIGTYQVDALGNWLSNGVTSTGKVRMAIGEFAGTDLTGIVNGDNAVNSNMRNSSGDFQLQSIPSVLITVTSAPKTVYLKAVATSSVSNLDIAYRITARKIN